MTHAQLEQQSRDAVIAYLQDSSVRLELSLNGNYWSDKTTKVGYFDLDVFYYRIAQPKPWYRVALFKDGTTTNADNSREESKISNHSYFVKWLTDRIEYDN